MPEARSVLAISQCSIEQAQQVIIQRGEVGLASWCSFIGWLLSWSHVSFMCRSAGGTFFRGAYISFMFPLASFSGVLFSLASLFLKLPFFAIVQLPSLADIAV